MSTSATDRDSLPVGAPAVGEIVGGKYELERVLGVGGMGIVFAARHRHLDERVAIKFLLPQYARETTLVARFLREATAASRVRGEHVARVLDVTTDAGAPYIVMELLEGTDLADVLATEGPLGLERTIDYILQTCEALAEAHVKGIVHRDLKPSNLFLARLPDGREIVKVVDFGIAKFLTPEGSEQAHAMSMTHTATVLGSPLYMSPEQLRATKTVNERTDIWSLGVIFYQLLRESVRFREQRSPRSRPRSS